MASSSSLIKTDPQSLGIAIIFIAVILYAITVFSIITTNNVQYKELVNYEFHLILKGNGYLLKSENKRDFIQSIALKDSDFYIKISDFIRKDDFQAGSFQIQKYGHCVSQNYFEFDLKFCRPNIIPWDFLKIITICFASIILTTILILRYLTSEMILSFKKLFSTAKIPHSTQLNFSSAWKIATNMADKFQEYQTEAIASEKNRAIVSMSKQVAHDILSPVSTLNLVFGTIRAEVSQEKFDLIENSIQRINGLANDLLFKAKSLKEDSISLTKAEHQEDNKTLLLPLIKNILAEKEVQLAKNDSKITFKLDLMENETFVIFSANGITRILSNILNNSIEAIETEGEISIGLKYYKDLAVISIVDSGKGIPPHILKMLGTSEITFGKKHSSSSGNGLGIYHAKKTLESAKGQLVILSREGLGTSVEIRVPILKSN